MVLAVAVGTALAGPALGQGELGRVQYHASCAQCHGPDGKGDGPLAELMTISPPDLTRLQRDNRGVFPFGRIYDVIENGGGIGAHGVPDMPAWGERLVVDAFLRDGVRIEPGLQEAFVRARILALIDRLSQIQEQ